MNILLRRACAAALSLLAFLLVPVLARAQPVPDCPPGPPPLEGRMEELQSRAQDRGLLWRLEKSGRVSWLYGTLHVGRPEWLVPGPTVQQAIASSDAIALELDLSDPATLRTLMQPADPAIAARVLNDRLRARLRRQEQRSCLPPQALEGQRPIMEMLTLQMNDARREGYFAEMGVEFVLMGLAPRAGKRIVGLETAAQQLAVLTPANDEEERQAVDDALADIESGKGRRMLRRMAEAWAAGDEPGLASYAQWCDCLETPAERRFFARVNDERNAPMADKLDALHASGARFFAAIGALHMTGPQALPALMRARGYRVERVPFQPTPR